MHCRKKQYDNNLEDGTEVFRNLYCAKTNCVQKYMRYQIHKIGIDIL